MTIIENPPPLVVQVPHIRELTDPGSVAGEHARRPVETYGRRSRKERLGLDLEGKERRGGESVPTSIHLPNTIFDTSLTHSGESFSAINEGISIQERISDLNAFLERLGDDKDTPGAISFEWNTSNEHELINNATRAAYSVLGTDQGMEKFAAVIEGQNTNDLKKISDLKANAFDELGLGIFRNQVAEAELVETARDANKKLTKLINTKDEADSDEVSIKYEIEAILDKALDGKEVDENTLAGLGVVMAAGLMAKAASSKKGRKVIAATILIATLLASCGTVSTPQAEATSTPSVVQNGEVIPDTGEQDETGQQEVVPNQVPANQPPAEGGQSLPAIGDEPTDPEKTALAQDLAELEEELGTPLEPTPNETQELEVVGSVQIEGQQGEFDLIDPKLGQEVAAFDNLDQLGYAETGDGRWVIFDKETRLAIETVKRTDLERWKRLPGFDIREGFIKNDKLFRTYFPSGFFVNYREEDVPYDPTDANSEKIRVGVIKLFVPKGDNGGTFIDAIVLDNMYYIDRGFEDSALLPQGPEFETASGILNEVEIGSYLRLQTSHGGDLLDNYPRPDNPDVWVRRLIKFVEGHRNMNPDAYILYQQGNENLLVGPANAINFWTEADG